MPYSGENGGTAEERTSEGHMTGLGDKSSSLVLCLSLLAMKHPAERGQLCRRKGMGRRPAWLECSCEVDTVKRWGVNIRRQC